MTIKGNPFCIIQEILNRIFQVRKVAVGVRNIVRSLKQRAVTNRMVVWKSELREICGTIAGVCPSKLWLLYTVRLSGLHEE